MSNLQTANVTYLRNVKIPTQFKTVPLHKVLEEIKTGVHKEKVLALRAKNAEYDDRLEFLSVVYDEKDAEYKEVVDQREKVYKKGKTSLVCYTFSGTYEKNVNNANFSESSNLFHFDIDKFPVLNIAEVRALLLADPRVVFVFTSPSGVGLKGAYRIADLANKSNATNKIYFAQVQAYFLSIGIKLDDSCSDVSRKCFTSYDPDIFINYDAAIYELDAANIAVYDSSRNTQAADSRTQIALVDYCEISAEDKDPCSNITLENVYQYLPDVTELSYQKWLNVGFMLHHQFEGSDEGKDVFDKWSSVSGHYDAAELDDKWDSCKPNKKNPLTMRSLIKAHNDKQAVEKLEAEKKAREQKAADDKKRDEEAMGKGKALLGECTSHIELMRAVAPAINTLANGNIALESDFRALLIARYIELNTDGKMTNGEATKAMKVNAAADRAAAKKAAKEAEKEAEKAKNIKRVTDKTGLVASSCFLPRGDNGKIIPYFTSVASALQIDNFTGYQLAYDDFLGEIVIRQKGEVWERFEDKHFGMLRFELRDAGFDEVSQQTVKEAIDFVVGYNHVDVAIDWLNSVVWDGVPRVAGFMHKYFKTENTPYASAVSKYIWSGLAGRILEPGCKLDMVPTFKSEQGKYKSTALQNMAPHPEYFVEIDFSKGDDDIVRKMRGKCVLEIAELKGLSTKDAEHIKGFITVRKDEWIPKYREFATKADRRSMFFGTTNQDEFLSDPTGNRRHLPIEVGNVDNDAILRDNNQLWAEGAVLFRESGVAWQDAIELAKPEVEKFEVKDVWQEAIQNWISAGSVAGIDEKLEATDFTTSNILTSAVGLVVSKQGRREQLRVSGIMEKLGYKKHQARVDAYGGRAYLWYLPCF